MIWKKERDLALRGFLSLGIVGHVFPLSSSAMTLFIPLRTKTISHPSCLDLQWEQEPPLSRLTSTTGGPAAHIRFIIDQATFASSTMLVLWQLFFLFFLLRNNMDVKDTVRLRIGGYFLYSHGQETVDKPKKNHQRQRDTKYSNEISLFLHLGSCTVTFYI